MKTISLIRLSENTNTTFGMLIDVENNIPICGLIENAWADNQINVSCVPPGDYICRRVTSSKIRRGKRLDTFRLDMEEMNKLYRAQRTVIDFHPGTTHYNTLGCLLPVSRFASVWVDSRCTYVQGGLDSKDAFYTFMECLEGYDEFQLQVRTRIHNYA